jgi:hypothetical protein
MFKARLFQRWRWRAPELALSAVKRVLSLRTYVMLHVRVREFYYFGRHSSMHPPIGVAEECVAYDIDTY